MALWLWAPQTLAPIGLVAVLGLVLHVTINHRARPMVLYTALIGPTAAIVAICLHAGLIQGEWVWTLGCAALLIGLSSVVRVLTQTDKALRRAEHTAQAAASRWKIASQISKTGVWEYDAPTGRVEFSDSLLALTGLQPEAHAAQGGDLAALAPQAWRARVNASYRAARDGGAARWSMEHPIIVGEGREIWIEHSTIFQRRADGAITSVIGFVQDVTEQRAAERAALEANRAKSAFLAAMSHEIRTPMNAVLGMAEVLAREPLSPRGREQIATLQESGRLLMSILDDILDLSKIEAGKMTLETKPFKLASALAQAERLWRPRAQEKGLSLHIDTAGLDDLVVEGDAARLQQILFNLLSNAVKFTDSGGVCVRAGAIAQRDGRAQITLRVSDTGVGMTPAQRERLFTPYVQADASTARRFGGTGLGLAIVRNLVAAMDGSVRVDSAPGAGSVFTVCLHLPYSQAPDSHTSESQDPHTVDAADALINAARRLQVLLVEDHPVNQRVVQALLAPADIDVTVVSDGEDAVACSEAQMFDVILMDVNMPRMNGLDATMAIRMGAGPNAHTPIIGLTADAFEDQRRKGLASGMNDYVTKPIDPRALFNALQSVLTQKADAA